MSPERIPLVYIVDDDESFNAILVLVLKKYGIESRSFSTSKALLEKVKARPPDLCIVDLNLGPRENGYDLIASLRQLSNPELPIIICSSREEREVISHALEMGANDYLLKPLDREVLTSKLFQFISTTELGFSQNTSTENLQTEIDTSIHLDLKLIRVEEDGVTLLSNHLILKGTVVTLAGALMKEISGKDRPVIATVVASELISPDESYSIYLEFDATDQELQESIRSWLSKRWARSAPPLPVV